MMLVWLAALLAIGYLPYPGFVKGMRTEAVSHPALEGFRMAYACGDLFGEEFEERRSHLLREE